MLGGLGRTRGGVESVYEVIYIYVCMYTYSAAPGVCSCYRVLC